MFNIQEELKKLPDQPGVYIMHDSRDVIIYIGKAVSLRKRVHQYFQPSHDEGIKKAQMVKQIARFEYIVTDSELEALVLECNLIKEHRPKYNTMLRDDKTYPYIRVTLGEDFPRVLFSRQQKKDKSRYFGPYTSAGAVKDTIEMINKLYQLRTCNRNLPRDTGKERPCLNYHIHQCDAPCQAYISKEDYRERIDAALEFLNGNYTGIIKSLEEKMLQASEDMEFEKAIEYRELLGSVKQIAQKQKITHTNIEDKDIIALAKDENDAVVQVFFIRGGKLIGRDHFYMRIGTEEHRTQILTTFIKQFYSGTPFIPREIILPQEIDDREILENWLAERRGSKVYIRIPQKGVKEKLVELAQKNARLVLNQDKEKMRREEGRTIGAVKEIEKLLDMKGIVRMEAYDISNINGFETVGSMIVYEKGKPKRSDYRKFKLRTITGPDDYASMHEVLTRRFTHGMSEQQELKEKDLSEEYGSFSRFPDLIMMDGGRGQVNICLQVLEELGLDIPVCGMVKDDNHRTRGLYYNNIEIPIDTHSEGFKLITRIQDEAHRFAIEYHRSLRSKEQVHSVLDDIPGIGPSRRKALMKKYQSLDAIKAASVEDLMDTESMNEKAAQAVYEFFHKSTGNMNE
ncbi:MAG: excinuclease ABC subunit UvrC [Lachnospiraceae bacterium]|nr:excinuclease ABC subunit UvrC [Lachnospiraceae bacterium]